jgi:hypothetical protein
MPAEQQPAKFRSQFKQSFAAKVRTAQTITIENGLKTATLNGFLLA